MTITYVSFQASGSPLLPPNQIMSTEQNLTSANGRFQLILQADGNLVIKEGLALIWVADSNQIYSKTLHRKKCASLFTF